MPDITVQSRQAELLDQSNSTDLLQHKHVEHAKHSASSAQNDTSEQTQAQNPTQNNQAPDAQGLNVNDSSSSNPYMGESVQDLIDNLRNAMSMYGYGSTDGAVIQQIYYYATALFAKYQEATPDQQQFINSIMGSSMNGNITINFPGAPSSTGAPTDVSFNQSNVSFGQFLVEIMTMMHYYQDLANGDSTTAAASDTQSYLNTIIANLQAQQGNFGGNTPQWFTDMLQGAQNWSNSSTDLNTWMTDAANSLQFGPGSVGPVSDPNAAANQQFMFQQYIAGAIGTFSNNGSGTDWLNDYNKQMIDGIMQASKNPWEEMAMLMGLLQGIGNDYNNQMAVSGDAMNTLSSASNIVNQMIAIFNNPNPTPTDAQSLAYLTQELQTLSDNNPVLGNLGGSTGLIDNSLQNILQQNVPFNGQNITIGQMMYDAENGTNGVTFTNFATALQSLSVPPNSGSTGSGTGSTSVPTASSTISSQLGALVQEVGSSSSTFSAQTNQLSQMTQTFLSVFKEIEQDYLQQMQPMIDAQKSAIM